MDSLNGTKDFYIFNLFLWGMMFILYLDTEMSNWKLVISKLDPDVWLLKLGGNK